MTFAGVLMPVPSRRPLLLALIFTAFALTASATALAQKPLAAWPIHSEDAPQPKSVTPGKTSADAPSDAVVLFDGVSSDAWQSVNGGPAPWKVHDGVLEIVPGTASIMTKQAFGDCQIHLEFAEPDPPVTTGDPQHRGNSGVILMGEYELQVLDNFNSKTYADGMIGSIYGQYPPLVAAQRAPGQWQTYDIVFRRPVFLPGGELHNPATVTVFLNGVLVQDGTHPTGPTGHFERPPYFNVGDKLPLVLQEHDGAVRYRNIWLRPLPPLPRGLPPTSVVELPLSADDAAKYAGNYTLGKATMQFVAAPTGLDLHIHSPNPKLPAENVWHLHRIDRDTFYGIRSNGDIAITLEFSHGPKDTYAAVVMMAAGRATIYTHAPQPAE
jgi:hypothetical protein